MLYKKLLLLFMGLCLCVGAIAAQKAAPRLIPLEIAPGTINYFGGGYFGLGIGYDHLGGSFANTIKDTEKLSIGGVHTQSARTYAFSEDATNGSWSGSLVAGYGVVFGENVYVGLEGGLRYSNSAPQATDISSQPSAQNGAISATTTLKIADKMAANGALRVGYLLSSKVMVYGILGVEAVRLTGKLTHETTSAITAEEKIDYSYNIQATKIAFAPGIGIEGFLTNQLAVRLQYSYCNFGSITFSDSGTRNLESENHTLTINSNGRIGGITSNLIEVGLIYHLNNM